MLSQLRNLFFKNPRARQMVGDFYRKRNTPVQRYCHSSEINTLIRGHQEFHAKYFNNPDNILFKNLVTNGQNPQTMIIACSDSRVDPSIILNSAPGKLFVFRNVANLVPPCDNDLKHHGTSAALQYAVQALQVKNIIVMGHSHCGGIRALLTSTKPIANQKETDFITSWMDIAEAAKKKVLAECQDQPIEQQAKMCEEQSLRISLNNLRTFSWIDERVRAGVLQLHAWRFDLRTGMMQNFNVTSQKFEDLKLDEQQQKELVPALESVKSALKRG
jgi:carbonic anhydrase